MRFPRPVLRLSRSMLLRLAADVVMLNAALLLSLVLRYFWLVGLQESPLTPQRVLRDYIQLYLTSAWLLTLIAVPVFFAFGFYTRGRAYRGRYKAITVTQAVSLSYFVFGFVAFVLDGLIHLPRAAILVSWGLTLLFLLVARLWARLWYQAARLEHRLLDESTIERKVESVLVIGGDGYIGSALLPKLLEHGYRVRILSLFLYGTDSIRPLLGHPRLEIIRADFRQVDKVVEAMRDIDAVVHLGAIVGDPACDLDEGLTIDVNVMATRMIAEVAKGNGVNRFIFASSCSVYGASNEVLDENSALAPVSLYARSKIACEKILTTMADDRFAPVYLRFGTIYGLSGRTRFDLVVNLLTAKAVVEGAITVVGADQWRPFVHVDDAAACLLKTIEAPLSVVRNQVFNVGSDSQNYTIGQVAEIIQAAVPRAKIVESGSDHDKRNYRVSFTKIENRLQFTPAWTLEQGIEQVIDALRTGKVADYRDPKYSNVKFLSEEGVARLITPRRDWVTDLFNEMTTEPAST